MAPDKFLDHILFPNTSLKFLNDDSWFVCSLFVSNDVFEEIRLGLFILSKYQNDLFIHPKEIGLFQRQIIEAFI